MNEVENVLQIQDIIHIIKTKKFVIYGNGFVGRRFYRQVQKMGYASNVVAMAVTNLNDKKTGSELVKAISDVNRGYLVFIAVHDVSVFEMKKKLDSLGFFDYIWIYPYLFNLELGEPVKKNISMKIFDFLEKMSDVYFPAIYYLSVKDYCSRNIYGGRLYIKAIANYTTLETAQKRWDRFSNAIDRCRKEGYFQDHNIKVDENNNIIDGLHRLILAKCFGQQEILCDVYHCEQKYYSRKGIGGSICIDREELKSLFALDEIEEIKLSDIELRQK